MTDKELMQQALEALEEGYRTHTPEFKNAIAALRERLAQPEQEPVAWIDEFGNVFPLGAQRGPKHLNEPMKPLYTAPPQRKPLSDEEISNTWCKVSNTDFVTADTHVFARAIEAAHGIKGDA